MEPRRLNSECIDCMLKKHLNVFSDDISEEKKIEYMQRLLKILSEAPLSFGAPQIVAEITMLQKEVLNFFIDYTEEKRFFNNLMLGFEDEITKEVYESEDSLKLAVCYAMLGNYIDFGTMEAVDADKLKELLKTAKEIKTDYDELSLLRNDLQKSEKLVFLTDNCGEIVMDKVLLKVIKRDFPQINTEIIVKGAPVLNDATMDDAEQVGLTELFDVSHNGSSVAGTCLDRISESARKKIAEADVIIAKGQANFETLRFCGKNIYYVFMCKCQMFAKRFGVEKFSGMLVNDLRLDESV